MHIPSGIGVDPGRTGAFPQVLPIVNSVCPATQNDIPRILQREQDHATALLSLSSLLAALFVSYANRAAACGSTSATPSPERKGLQDILTALQGEIKKLRSDIFKMAEALGRADGPQVSSLRQINVILEDNINSLRAELIEAKDKHDQFMVDSNLEEYIGTSNLSTSNTPTKATKATDTRGLDPFQDTHVDDESAGSAKAEEYLG